MERTARISLGLVPRWLVLVAALALLFAVLPAGVARADSHAVVTSGDGLVPSVRWPGETRFHTAARIGVEFGEADAVVLARGDRYPDALTGSFLAGQLGAPILLSDSSLSECDACFAVTLERIEASGASQVWIVGGESAVPAAREAQLEAAGYDVTRLGGAERIDTAAQVALAGEVVGQLGESATAIVASADNFPDALVAGSLAYDQHFPLLLTRQGELSQLTADALGELGIDHVLIAGGTAAVSATVEERLAESYTVQRLGGANRQETAARIAEFAYDELGWVQDEVSLARGDDFADALTVGPFAGSQQHAIVLAAGPNELGNEATKFLESLATCTFSRLYIAGGTAAISGQTETAARTLLSRPGVACGLMLTPETGTNIVGEPHTVTAQTIDTAGDPAETVTAITWEFTPGESATVTTADETISVLPGDPGDIEILSESVTTAADGTAEVVFTSNVPGSFVITATYINADGEEVTATAEKVFYDPGAVVGPAFLNAVALEGENLMVVTYSEDLDCGTVDAADYEIELTAGPGVGATLAPDSVDDCNDDTVMLLFGGAPFDNDHQGVLSLADGGEVLDPDGNPQDPDDTVNFTTVGV